MRKLSLYICFLLVCIGILHSAAMSAEEYYYNWQTLDWGVAGVIPVPGDYDGDGLADPALYQEASGLWSVLLSGSDYAESRTALGGYGHIPVPADYDGDGLTDPAVYHQVSGLLTVMLSASNYAAVELDMPAGGWFLAGDYSGDGLVDPAVYQPESARWSVLTRRPREISDLGVLAAMYSNAIVCASQPAPEKIRLLTAITDPADAPWQIWRTNAYGAREIKVVSYMRYDVATNYYHPGELTELIYAVPWVTVAPELKSFCRAYTGDNLNLRLRQLLGMPATSANDTVVEFWVDPQYLLRPSRDPEIADSVAQLHFHTNTLFQTSQTGTNYINWFNQNVIDSNYAMQGGVWNGYPWTQLGYTFDWAAPQGDTRGLSEFIIPGKLLYELDGTVVAVEVVSVTPAVDYAARPDEPVGCGPAAAGPLRRHTLPPGIGR